MKIRDAIEAIEWELENVFRYPIQKALDPNNPDDYLVIEKQLADAVTTATKATEAAALKTAITALDIDWAVANAAQKEAVVTAAKNAIVSAAPEVANLSRSVFTEGGGEMFEAVMANSKFDVRTALTAVNKETLERVAGSATSYVTDEFGRIAEDASSRARLIIAEALAEGAPQAVMLEKLEAGLGGFYSKRTDNYWRVVSNSFANRARSYSNLSNMRQGGIQRYRIEAVLDTVTTLECRLMHGRTFDVDRAWKNFADTDSVGEPQDVKVAQPWLSHAKDDNGEEYIYYKNAAGERVEISRVERSAVGEIDQRGTFRNESPEAVLADAGILTPPFHGNCRTTILEDG